MKNGELCAALLVGPAEAAMYAFPSEGIVRLIGYR